MLYHSLLATNQVELEQEAKLVSMNSVESTFLGMAVQIVLKQMQQAQDEFKEEQTMLERFASPASGMYQRQSPSLVYQGSSEVQHSRSNGDSISSQLSVESSPRATQDSATSAPLSPSGNPFPETRRYRGDSIESYKSVDSSSTKSCSRGEDMHHSPSSKRISNTHCRVPGSMYLEEPEAVHFYQAEDGQLIFLNGFNMTCLLSDCSKTVPNHDKMLPPFPDHIEANVLEIENVHLTPEVRKRMPFLGHLPLYTDVVFVELDLHHILSEETKKRFKVDIAKRRKRRQSKVQAEKRSDREIKKDEAEKISERKARLQGVDPEDEFFRVPVAPEPRLTVVDLGPAVGSASLDEPLQEPLPNAETVSAVSFSQACRIVNDPPLMVGPSEAFPALGAIPVGKSTQGVATKKWGNPSTGKAQDNKIDSAPTGQNTGPGKKKKKGKGQKLVLFSTGGQRGSAY
jgi:hypothetical protein